MRRCVRFVLLGLVVLVADAAGATRCSVCKGLFEAWVLFSKDAGHTAPKSGALMASTLPVPDSSSAQEIGTEYQAFFQCLFDAPIPADENGVSSFCKDAGADRMAALVCQVALYIKTGRAGAKELV